ncbi:hypothetical protein R50076_21120 [Gilvimarinus japonicus]
MAYCCLSAPNTTVGITNVCDNKVTAETGISEDLANLAGDGRYRLKRGDKDRQRG